MRIPTKKTPKRNLLWLGCMDATLTAKNKPNNTLRQVRSLADIDKLSLEVIQSINPQSIEVYRLLHDVFYQHWHYAKDTLAKSKAVTANISAKRQALMQKFWEYRRWHHDQVLIETQKAVKAITGNDEGLTAWSFAGSTGLTSDIDVNLKGKCTEAAVKQFNILFKKGCPAGHNWDYESGVVYDVNVYAVDFMHKSCGVMNIISSEMQQLDQDNQSEAALVKLRLYMNKTQWEAYKAAICLAPGRENLWTNVEARYDSYRSNIKAEIDKTTGAALVETAEAKLSGMDILKNYAAQKAGTSGNKQLDSAKQAQFLIGSGNRIYEEKLEAVAVLRNALAEMIRHYNQTAEPPAIMAADIDKTLVLLRDKIAECSLYANEASITDGAVHHSVVGLQQGGAINMTKADAMNAVNEHLGDALKEIKRYDSLSEAVFKAGKYLWRMADAAKNMGLGDLSEVQSLYEVGFEIANKIKGEHVPSVQEEQSVKLLLKRFDAALPDDLAKIVIRIGTRIANAYNAQIKKDKDAMLSNEK